VWHSLSTFSPILERCSLAAFVCSVQGLVRGLEDLLRFKHTSLYGAASQASEAVEPLRAAFTRPGDGSRTGKDERRRQGGGEPTEEGHRRERKGGARRVIGSGHDGKEGGVGASVCSRATLED